MLLVDGLRQRQKGGLGQVAHQGIARTFFHPVEHADGALLLVAEGRIGALLGLAEVDGHAARRAADWRVLVHELGALARPVGQQAPAHQFKALRTQVEQLDGDVDAPREPPRQMLFLRLDLHRVPRLSHVHAVRKGCPLHPTLRRARGQLHPQLSHLALVPLLLHLPDTRTARHRASQQQARHRGSPGPGGPRAAAPHGGLQFVGGGLVQHGVEQTRQGLAIGPPGAHPGRVFRVLQQPGLDPVTVSAAQFAIHIATEKLVGHAVQIAIACHVTPPASRGRARRACLACRGRPGRAATRPGRDRPWT